MTRAQAERLLDSLSEDEQESLRRRLAQQRPRNRQREKDW